MGIICIILILICCFLGYVVQVARDEIDKWETFYNHVGNMLERAKYQKGDWYIYANRIQEEINKIKENIWEQ